jgi:hypothetical protein
MQQLIWDQINARALYAPIYFYLSAGGHDWKTQYPFLLLNADTSDATLKLSRENTESLMIDSLNSERAKTPEELLRRQIVNKVDIFIVKDAFQDPETTMKLTVVYLRGLINANLLDVEVMLIIQGRDTAEYIRYFEELIILATNAKQCVNCKNNLACKAVFWQTRSPTNEVEHINKYKPTGEEHGWTFRFAIGGLIRRREPEQEQIVKGVLSYAVKVLETINLDVFPEQQREIMVDTEKGKIETHSHPGIQFHLFGVGATKLLFPLLMLNQKYIISFDSKTPSSIAAEWHQVYNKHLGRVSVQPTFIGSEDLVKNLSALNTLRGYYNIAMLLYAMESAMTRNVPAENPVAKAMQRFIRFSAKQAPKSSKVKPLEEYMERTEYVSLMPLAYTIKAAKKLTPEELDDPARIETAIQGWIAKWQKSKQLAEKEQNPDLELVPVSLALLQGLVVFRVLTIRQVAAYFPFIRSPNAAMNVITKGYDISRYWICEDIPEYAAAQYGVKKAIQIREKHLDLVLKYLLQDESLIAEYRQSF